MSLDHLQRETIAVILGGGLGSRLFPLTRERSKPAVPLGGKFRFIDVAVSNSINSGLRQIFVLTQFNSASLNNHVAKTYKFDAFSPGFVAILAAEPRTATDATWYQGTADAVRQNLRYLRDPSFRSVLIMPGDHLCRINLAHVLLAHERSNADVTLCAAVVDREEARRSKVIKLDGHLRVSEIYRQPDSDGLLDEFRLSTDEKAQHGIINMPLPGESYLVSMGIYVFKRDVLTKVLEHSEERDLGSQFLQALVKQVDVASYVFTGYWRDIGTIQTFYDASIALTAEEAQFRFQDADAPIYTHARNLPAARIFRSMLDGALVADGATIDQAHIERSVIGVRAYIGPGSSVSHSVVFGADTYEGDNRRAAAVRGDRLPPLGIGPGCVIHRAIIDKNARIGAECRFENQRGIQHWDGEDYYIREGIIIVPKNGVIPPGTEI